MVVDKLSYFVLARRPYCHKTWRRFDYLITLSSLSGDEASVERLWVLYLVLKAMLSNLKVF